MVEPSKPAPKPCGCDPAADAMCEQHEQTLPPLELLQRRLAERRRRARQQRGAP